MQEQKRRETEQILGIALLDNTGHVVAFNQEWGRLTDSEKPLDLGSSLTEIGASVPGLKGYLERATETRQEFTYDKTLFSIQLLSLSVPSDTVHSLLLVAARPAAGGEDISARIRHDLKNRIGGLKLYVTFLKRKLSDQPDLLDVVNKMSDSLDQMNLEANKIRF
jgi:hypothetical protein